MHLPVGDFHIEKTNGMKKIFRRKSTDRESDPSGAPQFNASYLRRLSLPNNSLEPVPNHERRRFSIAGVRLPRDHVPSGRRRSTAQANAVFRQPEDPVPGSSSEITNSQSVASDIALDLPSSNAGTNFAMDVDDVASAVGNPVVAEPLPANGHDTEDAQSVALSDTKTLYHTRQSQMELQETYNENFTLYVPYLYRQWRLATIAYQNAQNPIPNSRNLAPVHIGEQDDGDIESATPARQEMISRAARAAREYVIPDSDVDDDISTVIGSIRSREEVRHTEVSSTASTPPSSPHSTGPTSSMTIMGRSTSRYNNKRQLVIANEFFKHNAFVFVDLESFKAFKNLRLNAKQEKKNSSLFYDPLSNTYRRFLNLELPSSDSGLIPDMRQHIIGAETKALGVGLPLLKVQVPYLSSFRKNAPFIVFKRFREIPLPPVNSQKSYTDEDAIFDDDDLEMDPKSTSKKQFRSQSEVSARRLSSTSMASLKSSTSSSSSLNSMEEDYETYEYCTVHVKYFQHCRRYILQFNPENEPSFSVLIFQHNFKPFADFVYKNTRFRVYGTPIVTGYLVNYNPTLKLMIVDPDKPSLCDEIINKKQEFDLKSLIKRRRSSTGSDVDSKSEGVLVNPVDERVRGMDNPYPGSSNGLIHLDYLSASNITSSSFVANKLPTFGLFKDVMIYDVDEDNFRILPKKYTEVGKIETYQEVNNNRSTSAQPFEESLSSTKTVNTDTLVLTAIMLTLREVSIRNSSRQNSLLSSWNLQGLNAQSYRYGNGGGFLV